jgi:spermidine synthase
MSTTTLTTRRGVLLKSFPTAVFLTMIGSAGRTEEFVRESAYNYIIVRRDGSIVWLRRIENGSELSAIDLEQPARQVIPYTRYLFLAALFDPRPHSVLSIGLGAGAFNRLFNLAYPESRLMTVEIDPMIVEVAREFTGFAETANNGVEIADGRRFLARSQKLWDWIVLDAYVRKSQIPPHLTTVEFFTLVRSRLTPDGVFAANLSGSPEFVRHVSMTITAVFPNSTFWPVGSKGNVVCVASLRAAPLPLDIVATPAVDILRKNEVDLADLAKAPHQILDLDATAVLTDDFAPTEFLNKE